MYWSRFHSTNFQGPVPTGALPPKASSPTFSVCLFGTMLKYTSRSSSSGKGLSVTMWIVSGSTIRTSFTARMLPYCGDFFFSLPGSVTRSKENFTSSAVSGSPLWNFTPRRSLNSQVVSFSAFQEVASDGSYSSFALRCSSESNMLMLTSTPTRSKCMCGSSVGACEASAIVSVLVNINMFDSLLHHHAVPAAVRVARRAAQADAGRGIGAEPGRVVVDGEGRAQRRVHATGCAFSQRRSRHGGRREVLVRALPRRRSQGPQGHGQGDPDAGAQPRALRLQGAVARFRRLLRHVRHQRRLGGAAPLRRARGRGRLPQGADRRRAVQVRQPQPGRRARPRGLR